VLFVVVHLAMVLVSGLWNNLRSMITGWYDLGRARTPDAH
jgi:thiosulfate reductase cytochrome b subunit